VIITADALAGLEGIPTATVDTCITSPPYYGLRDYSIEGQIGLEASPEEFIERLVEVFRAVRRTLKDDGTLWVNLGDSYAGGAGRWGGTKNMSGKQASNNGSLGQIGKPQKWQHPSIKQKDLIGVPWLFAFAMRADGWYLRQDIIWHKPNPMPESVTDRCTKAHEYIFLFSKSARYYFDSDAIKEPATSTDERPRDRESTRQNKIPGRTRMNGLTSNNYATRNKRDVWTVTTRAYKEAHFATFPPDLIRPCVRAGSRPGGIVLDPFFGAGTTGLVAAEEGRQYIGIDLNPEYCAIAERRLAQMRI
jgi:DNA modification methylase